MKCCEYGPWTLNLDRLSLFAKNGATVFGIMTLGIMTFSIPTLSITTFRKTTLNIMIL
jgi:hypothetical protein